MDGPARHGRVGMSFSLNDSNQVNMCLAGARQVRENTATCRRGGASAETLLLGLPHPPRPPPAGPRLPSPRVLRRQSMAKPIPPPRKSRGLRAAGTTHHGSRLSEPGCRNRPTTARLNGCGVFLVTVNHVQWSCLVILSRSFLGI
jgi:hypothetical protein